MKIKVNDVAIFGGIILIILIMMKLTIHDQQIEAFNNAKEVNEKDKNAIEKVKRPFVNIYDQKGRMLNVVLMSKPFGNDKEFTLCKKYKEKYIMLGISSYLEFPNMVTNPYENFTKNYEKYKYKEQVDGWIHCFRNPEDYFPPDMPTLFASESDWTDCNFMKPSASPPEKEYDFIYICLKVNQKLKKCDDWATWNKNWALGKKCLDVFCNKFKLKGLLIGRKDCPLPQGCNDLMETTDMIKYQELKKMYEKAKFLFLPNEKDASPRVLTEALSMNLPVLCNENILGGWKYINDKTGTFFKNEKDVGDSVTTLLRGINKKQYEPRKNFVENYGTHKSGERLKEFLYKHWGDKLNLPKDEIEYLVPEYNRKDYKRCK